MRDSTAAPSAIEVDSRPANSAASRALVALAVAATITGNVVLAATPGHFPDWSAAALLGLALGQTIVAAAWLALGSGNWLARCITFPLAAILLAQMLAPQVKPTAPEMLGVLLTVGAAVALPLAVARVAGLRLVNLDPATPPRASVLSSRRYSLASLFAVTTVVAVFAAAAGEAAFPGDQWVEAAIHCLGFAAAAILPLAMFASGTRGNVWIWLVAAIVLGAVCGALPGPVGRVIAVEATFLFAVACLFMHGGRRVVWHSTAAATFDCRPEIA